MKFRIIQKLPIDKNMLQDLVSVLLRKFTVFTGWKGWLPVANNELRASGVCLWKWSQTTQELLLNFMNDPQLAQ